MPSRIQLSRKKGFRLPAGAVNCARPGKWGNPFYIDPKSPAPYAVPDAKTAVRWFRELITAECIESAWMRSHLHELRGKDLACWCPLGSPCHADALLELANATPAEVEAAEGA